MRTSLILFAVVLAAGCSTVDSRIRENQAAFDRLPPGEQARVREGRVAVGDAQDIVRIALGEPDERRTRTTASGSNVVWVYNRYFTRYHGTATVGYHRRLVVDDQGRVTGVYYVPIRDEITSTGVEPRITIEFADGLVSAIEQVDR
jgi:hypothetical protein